MNGPSPAPRAETPRPRWRRRAGAVGSALLVGGVVAWWWLGREGLAHPPGPEQLEVTGPPPLVDPGALAGLHEPGGSGHDDLRIVGAVLRNYLQSVRGPDVPPLGFNEEIVRALRGANPLRVAFVPLEHPSFDSAGRILDRWGTPYLFHPLAAEEIEIRSAGPDGKLFTADDQVGRSTEE